MLSRFAAFAMLAAMALPSARTAEAADHNNLEEGFPTTLQDAYTIKRNALEFDGAFRYGSTHNDSRGKDLFTSRPVRH